VQQRKGDAALERAGQAAEFGGEPADVILRRGAAVRGPVVPATVTIVPSDLVPAIRQLLARRQGA